jgi:hypothetical protein
VRVERQRREAPGPGVLERARGRSGLNMRELWVRYVAIGGDGGPGEVQGYLDGAGVPSRWDYNLLVDALNERFTDLGMDHPVAYQPA